MTVIKKTIIVLAIFLVTPIVALCLNWDWDPNSLNNFSEYLFWITESAGAPWGTLTCVFFFVLFCVLLKLKIKKQIFQVWVLLVAAVLVGQGVKSAIKNYAGESRPFVLWMEKEHEVDDDYFYSLPRVEREELIEEHIAHLNEIPDWLVEHWQNETGYSFPSGHTMFATTWAFLALVLLGFRRHHISVSIIIAWAIVIEISRLALGMHHPIDLILGAILSWLIAIACYFCAKKWHIVE
ncbi:phosphatidylglycerophosphatase B [Zophobihabitans entericus]|uniref:undecaprenyl-diphosphate phosphatase n=1 Tax=Zophobihabitans entericus TaxID=1635327 RepID=A0A6G9IC88_9GAMM|nr:phosphatidylglycerophosphatase B [Zophobihabitans entericus]QIQ21200.1 phosphatidylglycerophosphatase B [Zophobihabitans entericus]